MRRRTSTRPLTRPFGQFIAGFALGVSLILPLAAAGVAVQQVVVAVLPATGGPPDVGGQGTSLASR